MDPQKSDLNNSKTQNNVSLEGELEHVTQEMYKKNVELNDRNKTLSLLRKIDVITLSTVTDIKQIAQQIANAIVEESSFKGIVIYELDPEKRLIIPLAASYEGDGKTTDRLFIENTSVDHNDHVLVKTLKDKKPRIILELSQISSQIILKDELNAMQNSVGINSAIILPLVVRDSAIGLIVLMLTESFDKMSDSEKNMIQRLTGVIGIALSNSTLYRDLQDANEKLKEIDKLKDEFVSLASHELRTPMTVIKSYVWLLLQGKVGPITEKQKAYLDRTFSSTNRLINMVNDMLNISRIESGRLTIDAKPMDIEALIKDVIIEMQPKASELGINLVHTPSQTQLPQVMADGERVKQVLINLIGNSLKFTPKDGTISLITSVQNNFLLTQVKDTGRGISAADIEKLFKKFNMVGGDHLVKQNGQGTGLGLYLSKSLIELQKGRIWVESEGEGKGSVFSFTLPIVSKSA